MSGHQDINNFILHMVTIMADGSESKHFRNIKKKNILKISFKDAKKKAQKKYSCLEEIDHSMNLSVSPKYIGSIRNGLKEEMDKFLFSYQPILSGVPLAYDRIQIVQSKIIDDQEFLNIDIRVKLVVFQPSISKVLRGMVNKIGNNKKSINFYFHHHQLASLFLFRFCGDLCQSADYGRWHT